MYARAVLVADETPGEADAARANALFGNMYI